MGSVSAYALTADAQGRITATSVPCEHVGVDDDADVDVTDVIVDVDDVEGCSAVIPVSGALFVVGIEIGDDDELRGVFDWSSDLLIF